MNTEQRKFTYTNEDGTTIDLVAELQPQGRGNGCIGCVGQYNDPCADVTEEVCNKLPPCAGIVWKVAL